MLRFMERATIYYLKQKGWSNVQIAKFTGHHRDTVAKVLKEPVDQRPKKRERKSTIDVFQAQISAWLEEHLPVICMLERARSDPDYPYQGSETAFYDYVRKLRRARQPSPHEVALRFEGMPGEFLQVDWGEVVRRVKPRRSLLNPPQQRGLSLLFHQQYERRVKR